MSNFAVVILSRSARNLTSCLENLFRSEPDLTPDRVIVLDDGVDWGKVPYGKDAVTVIEAPKPFAYARNANIGIRHAAPMDVILLNDDAALCTKFGFTDMARSGKQYGILSAAVDGIVGNTAQHPADGSDGIREDHDNLAFVCVLLRRRAIERVGLLDERFNKGYGCEDTDYCLRAHMEDVRTGIYDGCIVEHPAPSAMSSFRNETLGWERLFAQNRLLFERKWKGFRPPKPEEKDSDRIVEVAYLAFNRLEFTRTSFQALLANTDWFLVKKLVVYDDGSTDGTREFLDYALRETPPDTEVEIRDTRMGHCIAVFRDFIDKADASLLAKIDNDTVVPEMWLNSCLDAMERYPQVELLGIEPVADVGYSDNMEIGWRDVVKAQHIGGIGLFKRGSFSRFGSPEPLEDSPYSGFTDWQWAMPVNKSWINPGLPVVVLDKIDAEPWNSLSERYISLGWQRPMDKMYGSEDRALWEWVSRMEEAWTAMNA